MHLFNLRSLILLVILLFCGCGHIKTTYTSFSPQKFDPTTDKPQVHISLPQRPVQIIGLIQADGSRRKTQPELIESLKKKAKDIGADGIYLLKLQEAYSYQRPRAYALAIRNKQISPVKQYRIGGMWAGHGFSTETGEFKFSTTMNELNGGISGTVMTSTGFTGSLTGYIDDDAIEFYAIPSNPAQFCIYKFVGSFSERNVITGQFSSFFCGLSEGGVIKMVRSKIE
jgi:hypothetical protein